MNVTSRETAIAETTAIEFAQAWLDLEAARNAARIAQDRLETAKRRFQVAHLALATGKKGIPETFAS